MHQALNYKMHYWFHLRSPLIEKRKIDPGEFHFLFIADRRLLFCSLKRNNRRMEKKKHTQMFVRKKATWYSAKTTRIDGKCIFLLQFVCAAILSFVEKCLVEMGKDVARDLKPL